MVKLLLLLLYTNLEKNQYRLNNLLSLRLKKSPQCDGGAVFIFVNNLKAIKTKQ